MNSFDSADTADIFSFLQHAKQLISEGKYTFINRKKCLDAIAEYGLTLADVRYEILSLTVHDYYKGPKPDFNRTGDVWEFKKNIDKERFYIKLKIDSNSEITILKCLSFHEDEF